MLALFKEFEDLIADDPSIGLTALPTLVIEVNEFVLNTTQEANLKGWRAVLAVNATVSLRLS